MIHGFHLLSTRPLFLYALLRRLGFLIAYMRARRRKPGDMSGDEDPQTVGPSVFTSEEISDLADMDNSDVELDYFPLGAWETR